MRGKEKTDDRPYADPSHPGNRIRARTRCMGCGAMGCTAAWGPWCFTCNVKRIDRISGRFEALHAHTEPSQGETPSNHTEESKP